MNKNSIKKFAIDARKKLIASVTDKAGMLGITPDNCSEAITKGADFEVYRTAAGTEVTLNRKQCEQRRKLVDQIHSRGFEAVIEEVAYTWFNRICAIRFMEVNDYMHPVRVRVLSSEKEGKNEPDVLTMAPDIDWNFTNKEREYIIEAKMNNQLDDLFKMLFIKQCNLLHEVLPGLFEETEDYTEMLLNISFTNEDDVVRMLIDEEKGIPEAYFNVNTLDENGNPTGQVEIIGWLYQYYNTELKDDTFEKLKKNIKISKERIPAATQLFTPDWIVRYMVENSVGRIWIEHLRAVAQSVDEKTTAEKFGWKYYLPEAEQEESVNVKLAEIRTTYQDLKPEDITCIDPCMGSGHILVAMFDVLMDIYESAGYDKREAAFEIVQHNIHGLDIDKRAYQLAYFAVMMKGRGYNRRFLNSRDGVTPEPKVYAIEESNEINRNHLQFFGLSMEKKDREKAEQQIRYLLDTFVDAREYGSILNVEECDWELLEKFVSDLQIEGQFSMDSIGSDETQDQLFGIVKTAENMGRKYDVIVTNPPYMGNKGMPNNLSVYVKKHYTDTKTDLFSCFIDKGIKMSKTNGYSCMVTMQSWMFISSFKEMRERLLLTKNLTNLMHMDNMVMGIAFGTAVSIFRNNHIPKFIGTYNHIKFDDIIGNKPYEFPIKNNRFVQICSDNFLKIACCPIAYWVSGSMLSVFMTDQSIGNIADARKGLVTGNDDKYLKLWTEVDATKFSIFTGFENTKWKPCNKGGNYRKWYGNNDYVVNWGIDGNELANHKWEDGRQRSSLRNSSYFFKEGITWTYITSGTKCFRYYPKGFAFAGTGPGLFVHDEKELWVMLAYTNSVVFNELLKMTGSSTISLESGEVERAPYISNLTNRNRIEELSKENVKIAKEDWDSYEWSWGFKRHPLVKDCSTMNAPIKTIRKAFELWNRHCESNFIKMKRNEEEINKLFIEDYKLTELDNKVDNSEVTVSSADVNRDIKSFISYAVGCIFGRYSLDEEGLILAGQPLESHFYMATAPVAGTGVAGNPGPYLPTGEYYYKDKNGEVKKCSFSPDADNIIPITDEEYFSHDIVSRFVEFVKTVYGEETLEENLQFIADALGNKGNTSREVIRNYFLKDFYADHLKVYQKRPIYWLFDSGKQNGFKALIYMHRYDADTVGRVRTDYLHKAQKYVETAMQSAQYTIDNTSSASEKSKATKAVTKYTKQLAEMKIYDEAIAHVANQRIEIDLDNGVKVNYAKFQGVEVAQEGKKAIKVDLLAKI